MASKCIATEVRLRYCVRCGVELTGMPFCTACGAVTGLPATEVESQRVPEGQPPPGPTGVPPAVLPSGDGYPQPTGQVRSDTPPAATGYASAPEEPVPNVGLPRIHRTAYLWGRLSPLLTGLTKRGKFVLAGSGAVILVGLVIAGQVSGNGSAYPVPSNPYRIAKDLAKVLPLKSTEDLRADTSGLCVATGSCSPVHSGGHAVLAAEPNRSVYGPNAALGINITEGIDISSFDTVDAANAWLSWFNANGSGSVGTVAVQCQRIVIVGSWLDDGHASELQGALGKLYTDCADSPSKDPSSLAAASPSTVPEPTQSVAESPTPQASADLTPEAPAPSPTPTSVVRVVPHAVDGYNNGTLVPGAFKIWAVRVGAIPDPNDPSGRSLLRLTFKIRNTAKVPLNFRPDATLTNTDGALATFALTTVGKIAADPNRYDCFVFSPDDTAEVVMTNDYIVDSNNNLADNWTELTFSARAC